MKPCAKNKKQIAWLALDALETQAAQDLRAHLETCEGCRRCLAEFSQLTNTLRAAEVRGDLQASESFHRRVANAVRAEGAPSSWQALMASFQQTALNWRVALPVFGAMAVVILLLLPFLRHFGSSSPAPSPSRIRLAANLKSDLAPTVANYRLAANRSMEALDDLLTCQASKPPARAPIYRASPLAMANLPD